MAAVTSYPILVAGEPKYRSDPSHIPVSIHRGSLTTPIDILGSERKYILPRPALNAALNLKGFGPLGNNT